MTKRKPLLDRLLAVLRPQLTTQVEVVIDTDDGELTIGAKRNALLQSSIGTYVCFVDDDDLVSEDYVSKILTATISNPDTCAFQAIISTNGKDPKPVFYSKKYETWVDKDNSYYRSPQHLSPIRREIAVKVKYPDTSMFEDKAYSKLIYNFIKTEVEITGPIYFYDYIPSKSNFRTVCPNDVFCHIDKMCNEVYGGLDKFNDKLIGLGVQFIPSVKELALKYPVLKPIGYQFEQLFNGSTNVNEKLYNWVNSAYEIWDYDLSNIRFVKEHLGRTSKFRPLLYANSLKVLNNKENPEIDVLFYGTTNDKRTKLIEMIRKQNPNRNIKWITAWGNDLNPLIENSKIVLNIHYYNTNLQEQSRLFFPLINGKCILSEKSTINYYKDIIIEAPADHLGKAIGWLLAQDRWRSHSKNVSNDFKLWSNDVRKRILL